MSDVTIKIKELVDGDFPLYHRYPGRQQPQQAFVEIDFEERTMCADWNAEIGNGIPMRVYHGLVRRFDIPAHARAGEVFELMGELEGWALEALEGFDARWDGSNWVGDFTEQADEALEAIDHKCADFEYLCQDVVEITEWDGWFQDRSEVIKMLEWGYDIGEMEKETKEDIESDGAIFAVDSDDMGAFVVKCAVAEIETFTELSDVVACLEEWPSWATTNEEIKYALKEALERYAEENLS